MQTRALTLSEKSSRETALKEVMRANRPRLTSLIRGLVRDQIDVEDVLQDVYEEFLTNYDLGTTIEKVSAWLVTVARNKIFDLFRRRRTRNAHRQSVGVEEAPGGADEWTRAWMRREIAAGLELLSPEQRQVFVMHELEGKSFEEIRAVTQAPLGTLLSRKRYAVEFLRNYLKEIYDELGS